MRKTDCFAEVNVLRVLHAGSLRTRVCTRMQTEAGAACQSRHPILRRVPSSNRDFEDQRHEHSHIVRHPSNDSPFWRKTSPFWRKMSPSLACERAGRVLRRESPAHDDDGDDDNECWLPFRVQQRRLRTKRSTRLLVFKTALANTSAAPAPSMALAAAVLLPAAAAAAAPPTAPPAPPAGCPIRGLNQNGYG